MRAAGKVEELTHEMKIETPMEHRWNSVKYAGKNFVGTSTPEGHKLFFSGSETDMNIKFDSSFTKTL